MMNLAISTANSRLALTWKQETMTLDEFKGRLQTPTVTQETYKEYMSMRKNRQDEVKDVGGYVAGELKDGKRKNTHIRNRCMIVLDLDNIKSGELDTVLSKIQQVDCYKLIHSTRKHTMEKPRLRVIYILDHPVEPDTFEACARMLAKTSGLMPYVDPTTFEPVRMMFWPSISRDMKEQYIVKEYPGLFLNPESLLLFYDDWKDVSEWPQAPGIEAKRNKYAEKQEDPRTKKGIIGAFCRTYDIPEAIEKFIPDEYERCGNRYTYTKGSTSGGAVLYQDGDFLYSHHATDPASGKLCNSFDLIRLHKFGELDADSLPGTPTNKLPSYLAMKKFAKEDEATFKLSQTERMEEVNEVFDGIEIDSDNNEWMNSLDRNDEGGLKSTIKNVKLFLENDKNLSGRVHMDEFSQLMVLDCPVPWDLNKEERTRPWKDSDDAGLRLYFEGFGIQGKEKILDGVTIAAEHNTIHPIRDYLDSLEWDGKKRLEFVLKDYFGAELNDYTKEAFKCTICAAVQRIYHPGTKFDEMLILVGEQGIGKSTFFRKLAGGSEYFSDSQNSFDNKDGAEQLQGIWWNEIAELASFGKYELGQIKNFLSKTDDKYRAAYGRHITVRPRVCVFVGTTNDEEFLKDPTGNRRFWPITCDAEKAEKSVWDDLDGERDQLFAEAVEILKLEGEQALRLSPSAEALAEIARGERMIADDRRGMVLDFLKKKVPPNYKSMDVTQRRIFWNDYDLQDESQLVDRAYVCPGEIYVELWGRDLQSIKPFQTKEINAILKTINGLKDVGSHDFGPYYGKRRGFKIINIEDQQ